MKRTTVAILVAAAVAQGSAVAADAPARDAPVVFVLDPGQLAHAKEAIARGDAQLGAALALLVERAETALEAGPYTVVDKTLEPPSGNPQDYMSFGPYWWPNPDTDDGLPYIRRDGEGNPEARTDGSDSPRLGRMARSAHTLALAHTFTGRAEFAERAALLLRTWFLDADTRMNPHLQYGQAIPGRVEGRGIGIIDTVRLTSAIDAAGLLAGSEFWTREEHEGLKDWFRDYLRWLQTSRHGRDERRAANNHGTFYDAQVACFALFVGDTETARTVLESARENRIARQIDPDGRQPRELARAIGFHYSRYNLDAMFLLGRLGEHVGLDLWNYRSAESGGIRAALDYIAPYADASREWPHGPITDAQRVRLLPLLRQGCRVYRDPTYLDRIQELPEAVRRRDPTKLLYPVSITR